MQVIIHRGANEIGGTCIQLSTTSTTILLDLGLPLSKESKEINLASTRNDAVLISHPHADHYGLIDIIDASVPVFIGGLGKDLITAVRTLRGQEPYKNDFRHFEAWKPFTVGDFTITPYLMDHSAADAYAFLIEAEGKKVFYSGDFRGHGRKSVLFERLVKDPPKDIDVLFMEGSMINRSNEDFPDEKAVEAKIFEVIKNQTNASFLICSSQNIDRIVSAYRACLRADKTLVLDFYSAWVLELVKKYAKKVPSIAWNNIKVFADYRQDQILKNNPEYFGDFRKRVYLNCRVQKEDILTNPEEYLFISKMSKFRIIDSCKKTEPVNVIYSQWKGYLFCPNDEYFGAEQVAQYQTDPAVNFVYAHTSGHAPVKDLKRFSDALKPKMLVPVHTEHPDNFAYYFERVLFFNNQHLFVI